MADQPNELTLAIPTNILGGGGPGLNFSFNFGPNVDALASGAYSFLAQQAQGAQAFQDRSIHGTQDFLSANVMPITNAVAGQADSYFANIMSAFQQTTTAQTQLGQQALQVQSQVSNASINSSNDSSGGGSILDSIFGGCFITTAVCKYSGLPDDCDTLQTMRVWRDTWMQETPERRAMVDGYYLMAPGYVERISAYHDSRQEIIWGELERLILTACHYIKQGSNRLALAYYLAAVEFARVAAEKDL